MSDPAHFHPLDGQHGSAKPSESTARAIRKMFAAVAPRYDFLNHFLSLGRDVAWRKATAETLRHVLERPGSSVADLCCGTGDLAFELEHYSAGRVFGTDFCRPMLVLAKKKALRHSTLFLEADTLALPFPNAFLDLVTLAFGFRNLASYTSGLTEIRRVLKPNGVLAILEFSEVQGMRLRAALSLLFPLPAAAGWNLDLRRSRTLPVSPRFGGQVPQPASTGGLAERAGFSECPLSEFYGRDCGASFGGESG